VTSCEISVRRCGPGFTDVRAEIRTLRGRLETLLLATVGGLLGVIATLVAEA
jgi:hypothetical protein